MLNSSCINCPLYNKDKHNACVKVDTNCSKPEEVDLLILAEAPAKEEVKQNKPLVGDAGSIFRQVFKDCGLEDENYCISNVVRCSNIQNDRTYNPPPEAIECCKDQWKKLIDMCNPKIIVVMGTTAMSSLGISEKGITKLRGKLFNYNKIPVMVTLHPSYIKRQGGLDKSEDASKFVADFKMVKELLHPINMEGSIVISEQSQDAVIHSYSLPAWCYSEDVCKMDIQKIQDTGEILYIFRNKKGEKIYHKENGRDKYFYMMNKNIKNAPMIVPVSETMLCVDDNKDKYTDKAFYESDLRTEIKHSIDYYFNRKIDEPEISPVIMYYDIEVYGEGSLAFPDPDDANNRISAISFRIKGIDKCYVLINAMDHMDKSEIKPLDNTVVKFYTSEKELLLSFIKAIRYYNPDIIAGWNSNWFDIPTIVGRMKKNNIDVNCLSPINKVFINTRRHKEINIYGLYSLDMLDLYKELVPNVEESYKLEAISQKELGYGKIQYDISIDWMYEHDINKFIEYSSKDSNILHELDKKLGHISLKFELIRICSTTWKVSENTTGLVDPLCVSYAKKKNLVCRDSLCERPPDDLCMPGAYVKEPQPGLHKYLIDLDFSSLYPSIIRSMNIGPNTYVARIKDVPEDRLYFVNDSEKSKDSPYMNKTAYNWIYNRDKINNPVTIELDPLYDIVNEQTLTVQEFESYLNDNDAILTVAGTIYKGHKKERSFLEEILKYLMDSRKVYKKLRDKAESEKDEKQLQKYECMQHSYKILANSLYGVLANFAFRFYNIDMAKSITLTGQELVKFSGHHIGKYMKQNNKDIDSNFVEGYDDRVIPYVLYQDTDSLFIDMGDYLFDEIVKLSKD